jgi:hypothetical protein
LFCSPQSLLAAVSSTHPCDRRVRALQADGPNAAVDDNSPHGKVRPLFAPLQTFGVGLEAAPLRGDAQARLQACSPIRDIVHVLSMGVGGAVPSSGPRRRADWPSSCPPGGRRLREDCGW